MIFEWYSGSDASLEVPKRLTKLFADQNEAEHDERVRELTAILKLEKDRNWRAYIYYSIAQEFRIADELQLAIEHFKLALGEFDQLAGNFENVIEQYCRTSYHLVRDYYIDAGRYNDAATLGLSALSWLDCAGFDEFESSMFLAALGTTFSQLANLQGVSWYYDVALSFKARAHHLQPEDPGRIQGLIYALYNADRREECLRAFEMFRHVSEDYEQKEEVEDFIKRRVLGGSGTQDLQ